VIVHAMIDIETLSLRACAHILTIAARIFDPATGAMGDAITLRTEPDHQMGAHIDPATVAWWARQSEAARIAAFSEDDAQSLHASLFALGRWMRSRGVSRVWCKGPSFDAAILEDAYRRCGLSCPWQFHQVRDVRTIVERAGVAVERSSTLHDALADVDHQIALVVEAHRALQR